MHSLKPGDDSQGQVLIVQGPVLRLDSRGCRYVSVTRRLGGILVSLTMMLALQLPVAAQATGVGVSPSQINLTGALRGEVYYYGLLLFNTGQEQTVFVLSTEGNAGPWISFYVAADSPIPISAIVVPADGRAQVVVRIAIPETSAIGGYPGSIVVESVQQTPVAEGETAPLSGTGASVSIAVRVDVLVQVTGTKALGAPTTAFPTPVQTAVQPGSAGYTEHVVQVGENLTRIARQYGVTVQAIAEANGITNPSLIYIGQTLLVPPAQPTELSTPAPTATPTQLSTPAPTETPQPTITATPVKVTRTPIARRTVKPKLRPTATVTAD